MRPPDPAESAADRRRIGDEPARWSATLLKYLLGPRRSHYSACLAPISLAYAAEGEVSPGAQLFLLAATLFSLGIYKGLGQPNGNAPMWKENIIA